MIAGGLLAAPLAAEAQQAGQVYRIGLFSGFCLPDRNATAPSLLSQALRELGWIAGRTLVTEGRYAEEGYDQLPELSAQHLRLEVDVIATGFDDTTAAAKQPTATIPMGMIVGLDPIGAGFIASLARPGGNVTGMSAVKADAMGKRMPLLTDVLPKLSRIVTLAGAKLTGTPR